MVCKCGDGDKELARKAVAKWGADFDDSMTRWIMPDGSLLSMEGHYEVEDWKPLMRAVGTMHDEDDDDFEGFPDAGDFMEHTGAIRTFVEVYQKPTANFEAHCEPTEAQLRAARHIMAEVNEGITYVDIYKTEKCGGNDKSRGSGQFDTKFEKHKAIETLRLVGKL